jgi:hypothetical protein
MGDINEELIPDDDDLVGGELLPEARPLIEEVLNKPDIIPKTDAPEKSESSNSSLEHYFPKIVEQTKTETEIPSAFATLFDSIRARKDTEVLSNPNIEIKTEIVEDKQVDSIPTKTVETKPEISGLLSQINSKRLEYGTPSIASVGLPRPELSPLNIPSTSKLPEVTNIINVNEGIDMETSNNLQEVLPIHN